MPLPDAATYFAQVLPMLPGAAVALLLVVGALAAGRELQTLKRISPQPLARALTVIVPARNEAERLPATLDGLLAQHAPGARIIVFDDGSTDATPDLVRERAAVDKRLALLRSDEVDDEVPRDGFGKPIALARALAAAPPTDDDDLVLFLDADVVLSPGALGGLVAALEDAGADALSGGPRLICERAVEGMLIPAFVSAVTSRHRPSRVHDPERTDAFLNGQLILCRRAALAEAGGWEGVRHTVLEDVALAAALKRTGKRLVLADLREVAATRMYTSWPEIRQGFGKNAVPLHGGAWPTLLLGVASVMLAWAPWVSAAWSVAVGPITTAVGGLILLTVVLGLQATLRKQMGVPAWPVLLVPLFYPLVGLVFVEAALTGLRGGTVRWKGREYRAEATAAGDKGGDPS
jgi:hypothetical protein